MNLREQSKAPQGRRTKTDGSASDYRQRASVLRAAPPAAFNESERAPLVWCGAFRRSGPAKARSMQLKNGIRIQRRGAENAEWRGGEVAEVPQMVSSDWPARLCVSPRSQRLCVKVSQTSTAWIGLKPELQTGGSWRAPFLFFRMHWEHE